MESKTILITGATNGIGREAAKQLAVLGHRLILVGRDPAKGEALVQELATLAPRAAATTPPLASPFVFYQADLSLARDIEDLAPQILDDHPHIDVLLNNAGGYFESRILTTEGREYTWALNHLAYVHLTELLLPALKASPGSRIVNVASHAHMGGRIRWDDLEGWRRYSGWAAYAQSKLANIMFTVALARRLEESGVKAYSLHPGFVDSGFGNNNSQTAMGKIFRYVKRWAISPLDGARTSVYLCTTPEPGAASGSYFSDTKPVAPSPRARKTADQDRLWELSRQALGLPPW